MTSAPFGWSLWVIGCMAVGLGLHFHEHGDVTAVLKAALTLSGFVLAGLLITWLLRRLRR